MTAESESMMERMKNIVRGNDLCVMATVSEGKPHCSLMNYITDECCSEIFMISHKKTKKYSNLNVNPIDSLLIDTREEQRNQNRVDIKALTVSGEFQIIKNQTKKS